MFNKSYNDINNLLSDSSAFLYLEIDNETSEIKGRPFSGEAILIPGLVVLLITRFVIGFVAEIGKILAQKSYGEIDHSLQKLSDSLLKLNHSLSKLNHSLSKKNIKAIRDTDLKNLESLFRNQELSHHKLLDKDLEKAYETARQKIAETLNGYNIPYVIRETLSQEIALAVYEDIVQVFKDDEISIITKILFLAANPLDMHRLRLDEEIQAIDKALLQSGSRDKFDIEQHWAVRVMDIQGYLLRHKPDIIHFSGHGSQSKGIILEDNIGNSCPVSVRALSQLFSILKDNIKCVVLNACYSEQQAKAIAQHIECVIGMSTAIGDAAAISFASAFYQALGFGRDVKTAFDLGCLQIDFENLGEQDTPKLLAVSSNPKDIMFVHTG